MCSGPPFRRYSPDDLLSIVFCWSIGRAINDFRDRCSPRNDGDNGCIPDAIYQQASGFLWRIRRVNFSKTHLVDLCRKVSPIRLAKETPVQQIARLSQVYVPSWPQLPLWTLVLCRALSNEAALNRA